MKPCRLAALALLGLALAGCVSAPGRDCVRLARDGWFCLLPPASLAARENTNLVTVKHAGETVRYLGRLSITPKRLKLSLMSLAGVPAATLVWDGTRTRLSAPAQASLAGKRLVALLELSVAAPAKLRRALRGLTLSIARNRTRQVRRLRNGSNLVARAATEANGVTHIVVPRIPLRITLRPVRPDAGASERGAKPGDLPGAGRFPARRMIVAGERESGLSTERRHARSAGPGTFAWRLRGGPQRRMSATPHTCRPDRTNPAP